MQAGGTNKAVEPEKERRAGEGGLAAAAGQITHFTDPNIGDLDPVLQDDVIRRANSLPSNLVPPK